MNYSRLKSLCVMTGLILVAGILLGGCAGQKLSSVFEEADVRNAAENVVFLINQGILRVF